MSPEEKEWRLIGVMLLLTVVLFVVNIITPHGFANHVLYTAVVLIATASHHAWMPSVVAWIGTILTVVGMIMRNPAMPGLQPWMPFGNRAFTITMLWILVWFAWKRREAETALQTANDNLEAKVLDRTHDLTAVNQALRQAERQLRSLTAQLMTAQEEERRRISRELHDDINQRLALLVVEMGHLETNFPVPFGAVRLDFQSLAQRLAAISDDVRRIAYQFHPSILDDLGLSEALEQLANEFSENTGIKTIVVQEDFGESLPQDISSCLYRIVQESLANVRKHAKASRVELELTCEDQDITLCIRDSGVGFDLERARIDHRGLGLVSMRERVQSVHGRFEIQAEPGQGTRILVQIPLPGAHHEQTTSPVG